MRAYAIAVVDSSAGSTSAAATCGYDFICLICAYHAFSWRLSAKSTAILATLFAGASRITSVGVYFEGVAVQHRGVIADARQRTCCKFQLIKRENYTTTTCSKVRWGKKPPTTLQQQCENSICGI